MNILFLSPAFPPNAYRFCTALRARGATVLGIGDVQPAELSAELRAALDEYVFAPAMEDPAVLLAAAKGLVLRHGPIARLDSNGEHWLVAEAALRERLAVVGLQPGPLARLRSKRAMGEVFAAAGIAHPRTALATDADAVRELARQVGYPLIVKPDAGSGAADTFPVADGTELEEVLALGLAGSIVQPFVDGAIVTYDGLVDDAGAIVFESSLAYDTGIMQVRRGELDGHYVSLREIPPALAELGRRAVAAFDIRGRFFHLELFDTADGYVALEMNIRPPGGFTTDLMNDAGDLDVYDLWAAVVMGAPARCTAERAYFTAHAGRRANRAYRHLDDELPALLGPLLTSRRDVPAAYAVTMGNTAYLLRHPDLATLRAAIAMVQAPATSR